MLKLKLFILAKACNPVAVHKKGSVNILIDGNRRTYLRHPNQTCLIYIVYNGVSVVDKYVPFN